MPRPLPPHLMASTDGDSDAVKAHILDSAHRVIVRDGLAAASTRVIAEEAGVAVGTLYNYFSDRHDLIVAAMIRQAHTASQPLQAIAGRAGRATVGANVRRAAGEISGVLDRLVPLFGSVFSDQGLLAALRRIFGAGSEAAGGFDAHPLEQYLRAEQELGRVRSDVDCGAASSLILSLCHERAFFQFFHGTPTDSDAMKGPIDFICDAIVAPETDRGEEN